MFKGRETLFCLGVKLEYGIEIHYLDSGGAIEFLAGNNAEDLFRNTVRIRIAIGAGVTEKGPVLSDKAEIDSPGIYAYGIYLEPFLSEALEALEEVAVNRKDVPVVLSSGFDYAARETVDLLSGEGPAPEGRKDCAAGGGPAVEGEKSVYGFHIILFRLKRQVS